MNSVTKKIISYNKGRNPAYVHLKYKALTETPHRFFRGTCSIFNEYLTKEAVVKDVPFSWVCGDMHLENFGSYKGGNGLTYFDINDFDEACIAPCTVDLVKLCVSIMLASPELNINDSKTICHFFLEAYRAAILSGHASRLDSATAKGLIKTLFERVAGRKRKKFLKKRITHRKHKPQLRTDGLKYYPITREEKDVLAETLKTWVTENKRDEFFFTFLDAAFRIAGTGSLGLNRYCILVEGKGRNDHVLLDVKQSEITSLQSFYPNKQLKFESPAHMVVHSQRRMEDTAPAGFTVLKVKEEFYIFKEHQPSEDNFDLAEFTNNRGDFKELAIQLGEVVAWAQLRSSGLDKTATGDELISFAGKMNAKAIIKCADKLRKQTLKDYKAYLKDYTTPAFQKAVSYS